MGRQLPSLPDSARPPALPLGLRAALSGERALGCAPAIPKLDIQPAPLSCCTSWSSGPPLCWQLSYLSPHHSPPASWPHLHPPPPTATSSPASPGCQSQALTVSPVSHPSRSGLLFTLLTPDPQTFLGDSSVIPPRSPLRHQRTQGSRGALWADSRKAKPAQASCHSAGLCPPRLAPRWRLRATAPASPSLSCSLSSPDPCTHASPTIYQPKFRSLRGGMGHAIPPWGILHYTGGYIPPR